MTELEPSYFPVFKRENQLSIENRYCEAVEQVVQVRVNGGRVVVACCLAKVGCRVWKGRMEGEKCLLGQRDNSLRGGTLQ